MLKVIKGDAKLGKGNRSGEEKIMTQLDWSSFVMVWMSCIDPTDVFYGAYPGSFWEWVQNPEWDPASEITIGQIIPEGETTTQRWAEFTVTQNDMMT